MAHELETTHFGVVCLNAENLTSPWLNYEAGAITRSVDSRVCPVLHGLDKGEVKPPLGQLQLTSLDHDDVLLMMKSMNAVVETVHGAALSETDLNEAFDKWWPELQERLKPAPTFVTPLPADAEPAQPESNDKEMLTELLQLVRTLQLVSENGGHRFRDVPQTSVFGRPPQPAAHGLGLSGGARARAARSVS